MNRCKGNAAEQHEEGELAPWVFINIFDEMLSRSKSCGILIQFSLKQQCVVIR